MQLDLSAPKVNTFSIAVAIALIASIIHDAHISVPYITTGFTLLLVGFLPGGRQRAPRIVGRAWATFPSDLSASAHTQGEAMVPFYGYPPGGGLAA